MREPISGSLRSGNQLRVMLDYSSAVIASAIALALIFFMAALRNQAAFPILFLAVLASAVLGGLGPGLTATALSAAGYLFIFASVSSLNFVPLLLFVAVSVLLTLWSESRRRAVRTASLHASAENIPAAIFIYDESRLRYVNQLGQQATGYSTRELLDSNFSSIVHPDCQQVVQDIAKRVFRGAALPSQYEVKILTKTGGTRWLDCASVGVEFEGRRCVLSSAFDITARKHTEEILTRQAQLLDLAFEPILVRDANDRVIYWNHGAERLYGWTEHEALGQYSHRLLNTQFPKPLDEIQSELAQNGHWSGEVLQTAKDGRTIVVISLWTLNSIAGEPNVILETNFDTTERKRAEEILRMAEKLAAASRMAATVAHEINNPLEAVTNCLYLVDREQRRVRDLLDTAERELGRVAHITKQTLAFYRDNGTPLPVDVRNLLSEVLEVCAAQLAVKQIKVERQDRDAREILGYPNEIRQVILNILTNAIESGGKNILVRISRSRDWKNLQCQGLRITIADDGYGIVSERRKQLFRPFVTTKGSSATGLGLWVTRGIVQKIEGSIRLRTNTAPARSGTCVSIFFPSGIRVVTHTNKATAGKQTAA